MFILKKEAIGFLNQLFKLPATGTEQDWDVELANPKRLNEFLNEYNFDFPNEVKLALMALILASYENYLHKNKSHHKAEVKIEKILNKDKFLFKGLLKYWALEKENEPDNWFNITSFVRSFL